MFDVVPATRNLLTLALMAALAVPAAATTSKVRRTNGSGSPGTPLISCNDAGLRNAIANASSGDALDLTMCSEITLTAGEIRVNVNDLTLNGPGRDHLVIKGGASSYHFNRIFDHTHTGTLSIEGMTLTDADYAAVYAGSNVRGGCIYSAGSVSLADVAVTGCKVRTIASDYALGGGLYARSNVTLDRVIVSANTAYAANNEAEGGGLFVRGNLDATDSWIANNAVIASTSALGGGVALLGLGDANITRSTVSENQAESASGASIHTTGAVNIVNTTISSNVASRYIGGADLIGTVTIRNSTITKNTAGYAFFGAGIYAYGVTLQSSIVANNMDAAGTTMSDIVASDIFGSDNLITAAWPQVPDGTIPSCPRLGPLQDNGGATPTHALVAGSPAINTGNNTIALTTDQRSTGFVRTFATKTDIGGYEWQGELDDVIFKSAFEVSCDDY